MAFPVASGILLHPSSFPGNYGIGELGKHAYEFIDFLVKSKQKLWQLLPLGPLLNDGFSPYMSLSALAGNPLLIDLDEVHKQGFLTDQDMASIPKLSADKVDFEKVVNYKIPLLKIAAKNFFENCSAEQRKKFEDFCANEHWLHDFALFIALREAYNFVAWNHWPAPLAGRDKTSLDLWTKEHNSQIEIIKYLQYEFFRQFSALKKYANKNGVQIIGDVPIYVGYDSADVWTNPQYFHLKSKTLEPCFVAGVPPDLFSATGQLWGNPLYNWDKLKEDNYRWWVERFKAVLKTADIVRIDHFRGFESFWVVRHGDKTAQNGWWAKGPGANFFTALENQLGILPIIAEDLGIITNDVEKLRDKFDLPGLKIMQFEFSYKEKCEFVLPKCVNNAVAYTGTHDNETIIGWYQNLPPAEKHAIHEYLEVMPTVKKEDKSNSHKDIHWDLIKLVMQSPANQCIFQLQDVLGLDNSARMNCPGTSGGTNWAWRYQTSELTDDVAHKLAALTLKMKRS